MTLWITSLSSQPAPTLLACVSVEVARAGTVVDLASSDVASLGFKRPQAMGAPARAVQAAVLSHPFAVQRPFCPCSRRISASGQVSAAAASCRTRGSSQPTAEIVHAIQNAVLILQKLFQ